MALRGHPGGLSAVASQGRPFSYLWQISGSSSGVHFALLEVGLAFIVVARFFFVGTPPPLHTQPHRRTSLPIGATFRHTSTLMTSLASAWLYVVATSSPSTGKDVLDQLSLRLSLILPPSWAKIALSCDFPAPSRDSCASCCDGGCEGVHKMATTIRLTRESTRTPV